MKKQIIIAILVLAGIIFTGFSNNKFAVSAKESSNFAKCAVMSLKDSLNYSDAIFVGKVLSVKEQDGKKIFEFKVEKYWKGIKIKKVEVGVFETTRYQAIYQVGERYLVYARKEDGILMDRRCSRSSYAATGNAVSDIKQLGKSKIKK